MKVTHINIEAQNMMLTVQDLLSRVEQGLVTHLSIVGVTIEDEVINAVCHASDKTRPYTLIGALEMQKDIIMAEIEYD